MHDSEEKKTVYSLRNVRNRHRPSTWSVAYTTSLRTCSYLSRTEPVLGYSTGPLQSSTHLPIENCCSRLKRQTRLTL